MEYRRSQSLSEGEGECALCRSKICTENKTENMTDKAEAQLANIIAQICVCKTGLPLLLSEPTRSCLTTATKPTLEQSSERAEQMLMPLLCLTGSSGQQADPAATLLL